MYYEWFQANKKTIAVTGVGLFVALVVWAAVTAISHIGKVPVTISLVPADAKVSINGQRAGGGTQWLIAGTYSLKAEKQGFSTTEKKLVVTSDKKQNVAAMALTPESSAAKEWAEKHQNDYKNNQEFGSLEAQVNGEYFANQHPIVKKLPYDDPYYQIDYTRNDANDTVDLVIATPSPRYRYFAVQKIRELGFNPTDYRITFTDYVNPIKKATDE